MNAVGFDLYIIIGIFLLSNCSVDIVEVLVRPSTMTFIGSPWIIVSGVAFNETVSAKTAGAQKVRVNKARIEILFITIVYPFLLYYIDVIPRLDL